MSARSAAVFLSSCLSLLAAGAEPKSSRAQVSSNGRYSVRAVEQAQGQCRLQVSQEAELTWELPRCFGTADDLFFVSNDGERVWVLRTLPELPEAASPKKKTKHPRSVADLMMGVTVATLVDRAGQVVKARSLATFVTPTGRRNLQLLPHHFKWMEGTVGLTGKSPRSNAHNQVELEAVGPTTYRLDF